MTNRRVVVTGLGAITPIGNDANAFWQRLLEGASGCAPITAFDASRFKVKIACELKGYDPLDYFDRKEARSMDRFIQLAIITSRQALQDSGLTPAEIDYDEFGVVVGSGVGGLLTYEEQYQVLLNSGPDKVAPRLIPKLLISMAPGAVAIDLGLRGPNLSMVSACASGTHALGEAFRMVQHGEAAAVLAGGAEAVIAPLAIAGFASARALSQRNDSPDTASRPFSADRDGFVLGEGSAMLVLEDYEHARARGARIYGEVLGYGRTADAFHETAPAAEGAGAQRAMRNALRDAGLPPEEISYINAHGTSTPINDRTETCAIKAVFGERAYKVPISSTKSNIGHLCGAAGAVEVAASLLMMGCGVIPPTINYSGFDPDCDLDYVTEGPRPAEINYFLKNSFGFGGQNASLVLGRCN